MKPLRWNPLRLPPRTNPTSSWNPPHQLRWQKNPRWRLNRPLLPRLCRSDSLTRRRPSNQIRRSGDQRSLTPCKAKPALISFATVKQFLEFIIRQLVEFPDEMMLSEIPSGKTTIFRLQLRQTDVGRIIGRNGTTIQAIRALLASSAARHGQRATLEIVE